VNIFAGRSARISDNTDAPIFQSALDLIGNTPLFDLTDDNSGARVYAKAEFQNPSGSIKDRMVANIVQKAETRGELRTGDTIVEATSGNTGVSLAMIASIKGYKAIIVAPDSTSGVKKLMMEFFGAELVLTDGSEGIKGTVERARELVRERGGFLLDQFKSMDNPGAHRVTGREILCQSGEVDTFVAGVGTGGTLIGVGRVLKAEDPDTQLVAVEPYPAPALYNLFHGKELKIGSGIPHRIEGIGETFVPDILLDNLDLIDDVVLVKDHDAFQTVRRMVHDYGLCVGISSGANIHVARSLSKQLDASKKVVTVLPDSGQRYLEQILSF
jgi:cysteine synthase A